jgi:UDP-GlcNAc:undecaprenyl-phosphate/decaprenyl-phosphate GlcNAc-1-phosphate transferase
MIIYLVTFLVAFMGTLLVLRYKDLHSSWSLDSDLGGPQKVHSHSVPRVGGVVVFLSLTVVAMLSYFGKEIYSHELGCLLMSATPVFILGFLEDLTKAISVTKRFLGAVASSAIAIYLFDTLITRVDLLIFDQILSIKPIAIFFTCIAVAGLSNAFNIIDGFNGLASMVAIISLMAIAYVGIKVGDLIVVNLALIMSLSIAGFFVWNYPRGLIFLGDGGAYLIGFCIAIISILLVTRNGAVSPWFALLVNGYPIFETLFTIWRRLFFQGRNPGLPDGAHFHTLIYRRIIKPTGALSKKTIQEKALVNSKTSPYIWVVSSSCVFPAVIFWDSTSMLILATLCFAILYIWLYRSIVVFRKPLWFK